ncbi:hypothetical protein [Brevibacillus laterosporus]|uniref:Uncharacterized protein n=1 Tax=Brevibacillus laterosporus LMG 15441 TaxID=1042163 RepID=A0A075R0J8_BRELA|nr:hypothetical protein [Brevibacillus laterosporus]AIG26122.1 hypothetical protein BRLA_c017990 [Brevibacillus laterosporus LMG 15441]PCN46117.1 hypothetical protein B9C88_00920 [Brevibacillus laterosporus]
MTFDELREWSIQHNVEKRTKEGFLDVITNIGKDSPNRIDEYFEDKFNPEYLEINIYKVAFTIANWPECDFNYIASYAKIEYKGKNMGVYKLIFNHEGEVEDDYWSSNED